MESSLHKRDTFGTSGMYIVEPEYEKKKHTKCSNRWCLLLVVLLIIVVVAGATVGIRKAIQSSESSGTSKQEQSLQCFPTEKCTRTPTPITKGTSSSKMIASSSMKNVSPSRTSYPIPTSTVLTASSSMENVSPSRTSYPIPTSTVLTVTSWSRWQRWSECSSSCGGGIQTRNRTCGNPKMPNVIIIADCYGNNVLYRNCSTWKCPDCSKPCPIGHLNSACDACICTNITVTGTVKNENGALLNNATIAFSEFPFNILARTNIAGHFELRGICVSQEEMIVQRNGYLPQLLNANKIDSTSFTISARLEAIVFPEVTVQPESKVRIENQAMTLCCAGVGKPEPEYEWILNGRSVSEYQQDEEDSSKLIIPRVHRNMTGEVKCRVYNDYGAEFSNVAKITVITKNDSCSDTPLPKTITLPPGCADEETNSSTVNVGHCGGEKCIGSNLTSLKECFDDFCCQSSTEKTITIRCILGISFNVTRTTSCGCGHCSPKTSTVNGIATGPNNVPFKYGYIYHGRKYLTRAGKNGDFSFTMPGDVTRVVLNFKGKDRYNDFQDLTKVVPVVPGRETFVVVKMKPRPQPMLVNTSETIEIPMGLSNSTDGQFDSAPVVLSLPPQSLMTEDGETYNGTASVEVSFADPRNLTQLQEADGDFTAVSDDGDEQLLETFGVLKIDFKDSNGKKLQAKTDIDVLLDPDEYNITEKEAEDIKLWYMDEKTGRWRMMDSGLKQHESRRSKRSGKKFYFGKIDHTVYNRPGNLDSLYLKKICNVKIKVSENTAASSSQSVTVTLVSNQGGKYRYFDHHITSGTSSCMRTFCTGLTIQATIGNKILRPIDNNNIDVDLKDQIGIKYYSSDHALNQTNNRITIDDLSYMPPTCDSSSDENSLTFDVVDRNEDIDLTKFGQIKWHEKEEFEICYVKISTEKSCRDMRKKVYFHVKTTDVSKDPAFEEGFTIASTLNTTCAEFKCQSSNSRSLEIIVKPIAEGHLAITEAFRIAHETEGHTVFVGRVVIFSPIHGLRVYAAGVTSRRWDTPADTTSHETAKKECEEKATAGIIFHCT